MTDNENGKIVLLRLYCGDYIIGEIDDGLKEPGQTRLKNPRMFVFMPTMSGEVRAGFQTICPFSEEVKKSISIRDEQIMLRIGEDELGKDMVNGYNSHITGIKIASAGDAAALKNGSGLII